MYRMLSGHWPEYPFAWPPPGAFNLRRKRIHPQMIEMIRKAIATRPRDRFSDAIKMESEYAVILPVALRNLKRGTRG